MSDAAFAKLVSRVGEFHITDKAMNGAQSLAEARIRDGNFGERERREYLDAVRRYFSGFEREARGHLRDVDKRLEALNQVVFNLTAERAVAVKRIEATQSVLHEVGTLTSMNR